MELQHAVGMDKEAFRRLWEKLFPGLGLQFGPFGGVLGIRSLGEGVRYYDTDGEPKMREALGKELGVSITQLFHAQGMVWCMTKTQEIKQ